MGAPTGMSTGRWWYDSDGGWGGARVKRNRRKVCPKNILSTTNATRPERGINTGQRRWMASTQKWGEAMWCITKTSAVHTHHFSLPHASNIKNTNVIPGRVCSTVRCYENEHLLVVSLCILVVHMEPAVTQGRAVIALYANGQAGYKFKQKNRDMVKSEGQTFFDKLKGNRRIRRWRSEMRLLGHR